MQHAADIFRGNQKVVLAGCFTGDARDQAWELSATNAQPNPLLNCSAEEADTRIWLHVTPELWNSQACMLTRY